MDKLAGPAEVAGEISLEANVAYNVEAAASALDKEITDLKIVVMDRDRHIDLIKELRDFGVSVPLIGDGDIAAALDAANPECDIDLLMGIGAAPEGVITATALRGLGGHFEGRLVTTNEDHERRAKEMLGDDVYRLWGRDDLCSSSDALFVASGVCSGYLPGVEDLGDRVVVHSEVIDVASGVRRFISTEYPQ
jgi:fructose-1,6-bisphosphatase/sedoheptulose 1,7-bisphosphatase-like protein